MMAATGMADGNEVYFLRFPESKTLMKCVENATQCHVYSESAGNGSISLLTALTTYPGNKMATFLVDSLDVEYQKFGPESGSAILVGPIKNGVSRNPTAIAYYRTVAGRQEFAVFYDEIFTVQVIDFEERFKLNQPLVVSRSQDYQLSKTWLKCPPELCFDSRLDYAHQNGENIVFGRGLFSWQVSLLSKKIINGVSREPVQDFLAINGNLLQIRYSGYAVYNGIIRKFDDIFHGASSEAVDAAFELLGEYVLLTGSNAQVFKGKNSDSVTPQLNFVRNVSISQLLPGAPSSGFDAAANMDDQLLYLFSNNFYYKHYPSAGLSTPLLIQGDFINCEDSYYQSSNASRKLNISSYQDLLAYRSQFMEKSKITLWTESDESTNSGKSTMTIRVSRSSQRYLQITFLFLLISMAIVIGLSMVAAKMYLTTTYSIGSLGDKESSSQPSMQTST
ncbi:hypothetical protein HDE_13196 [Halotydeus destructor]|nr:hypothetical protein HDE_13196 [Halotydeus destructor]